LHELLQSNDLHKKSAHINLMNVRIFECVIYGMIPKYGMRPSVKVML